jgi:hypothetical protein
MCVGHWAGIRPVCFWNDSTSSAAIDFGILETLDICYWEESPHQRGSIQ